MKRSWMIAVPLMLALAACRTPVQDDNAAATPPAAATATPAAAPPAVTPLPFDEAVTRAADTLFASVRTGDAARRLVVIDPLIDGVTGEQSNATRALESRILQLARSKYPQFDIQPLTVDNLNREPLVLVGTFTGVNDAGKTEGARSGYRICLALADLGSRSIVGKGTARARMEGVDTTPLPYFRDSPAWALDQVTESYIKTCQGSKVGDPMDAFYLARVVSAASVAQAIEHYNARRYRAALDSYAIAMRAAAGDELRILNGVYLANYKLGQHQAARLVFGRIVDFGLERGRMAVKFLFRPGSTAFGDPQMAAAYPYWIGELAHRAEERKSCLEIVGHASRSGPEEVNERISLLRAETIKQKLDAAAPALRARTIAHGVGSRETLVGNGRDDASDLLDRRVVFKVLECG